MLLNCGVGEDSWTARSKQSILKEISPGYSLKGLMLKLKLQYFGHLMRRADYSLEKNPDLGKDWRQEKVITEDEMVGWHHRLNGHKFDQAPGVGDGQGSLACFTGSQRVRHNWANELNWEKNEAYFHHFFSRCTWMLETYSLETLLRLHKKGKVYSFQLIAIFPHQYVSFLGKFLSQCAERKKPITKVCLLWIVFI